MNKRESARRRSIKLLEELERKYKKGYGITRQEADRIMKEWIILDKIIYEE